MVIKDGSGKQRGELFMENNHKEGKIKWQKEKLIKFIGAPAKQLGFNNLLH